MKIFIILIPLLLHIGRVSGQNFLDGGSKDTLNRIEGIHYTIVDSNEIVRCSIDTILGFKRYNIWIEKPDSIFKHVFILLDSSGQIKTLYVRDTPWTFYELKFQKDTFKPIEFDRYYGDD